MKKITLLILLVISFSSCSYQLWIKPKYFSYLHENQETGIDSLLEIEGYYISELYLGSKDSLKYILTLYKNGTFFCDLFKYREDIDLYKRGMNRTQFLNWGTYRIVGDTIKSQTITNNGPMNHPWIFEEWYLITSKKSLKRLYIRNLTEEYTFNDNRKNLSFYFHSYPNRIESSANPYLKKKWFWRDKKAYKQWKDNNKFIELQTKN